MKGFGNLVSDYWCVGYFPARKLCKVGFLYILILFFLPARRLLSDVYDVGDCIIV
ncbi:hypothetical protein Hanom_Chr07g00584461 [Helianthus anomalus]